MSPVNEMMKSVSAEDVAAAQDAHWKIDNEIRSEVMRLTLDQKKDVLKKIRETTEPMI